MWALGTLCYFIGGHGLGFAVSFAIGSSAPFIGAMWGIYYGELKGADRTAIAHFTAMFILFAVGIALIALSQA